MKGWTGLSKRTWDRIARKEPYFAVLTCPEYLTENMTPEAQDSFFASGEDDIERFFRQIKGHIDPGFSPGRTLEFGCGIGRLLIPLARRCPEVVGVDVSSEMTRLAGTNLADRGIANCRLIVDTGDLSEVHGPFDLVISYIVFQHMNPRSGLGTLRRLVGLIGPGGVAVLHFAYRKPPGAEGRLGRALAAFPPAKYLVGLLKGGSFWAPSIDMYDYPLNEVLIAIQEAPASQTYVELTDHNGQLGATFFFRKSFPHAGRDREDHDAPD